MTLFLISFVAGALTVLAPCVLPLLPVIVGGSIAGKPDVWRVVRITIALAASVFVFTLLLKVSTALINIPAEFWQIISGGIVLLVGLFMFFPSLWEKLVPATLNTEGNKLLNLGFKKNSAAGDVIIGAALGPVFSSCSPTYFLLLAAVLPAHPVTGLFYLFAYVIGLAVFLFIIAFVGQRLLSRFDVAANPRGWIKRTIGVIFIILGLAIVFGIDKRIESDLPTSAFGITGIDQYLLQETHPLMGANAPLVIPAGYGLVTATSSTATSTAGYAFLTDAEKSLKYPKAPDLVSPDAYLNTGGQPISLAGYKGKDVVLVDFWTYSCINCLRTIPYLNSWYAKYKDDGLVIIGVSTPEFSFEHVEANVANALVSLGIKYPVVLDNEYKTWNAYGNEYWPHEYLVDIDGYIVHDQVGEGDYDVTERAIQAALVERAVRLGLPTTGIIQPVTTVTEDNPDDVQSPETYFGSNRNEYLANGAPGQTGTQSFTLPTSSLQPNALYLGGSWNIQPEYATSAASDDTIEYEYDAHDLYIVASAPAPVTIEVLRDGVPVGSFAGADVDPKTSTATIQANRLYKLIHDATPGEHTVEIKVMGAGLEAYTFTFG
jgi:cytochrome c biogenesis protein CcdA/thiol-disulfide isomerase/thioredoxin